jgi:hypothetical protein
MKKIKPLTEGKTKCQIKTHEGELPLTQGPPPARPPKVCGEWQINNKEKIRKQLLKNVQEKLKDRELFPESNQRAKNIIENSNLNKMEKKLGKIKNVSFGIGGYQDCQIGIHFVLGTDSWAVRDSRSVWDPGKIQWSIDSKWTEEDRTKSINDIVRYVSSLLNDAKVNNVEDLKGKPIEITMEGILLKEWRILTEVL